MLRFLFAIMDMGSTGTRLNIFGYSKNKDLIFFKKYEVEGGLHKMEPKEIKKSLYLLTKQISRYLYKIPMGFYCTAGFRHPLLYSKLNYIKQLLSKFYIREYGILSGKYEGYLSYRSLQYILNSSDFILIDMGGKSTQIVAKNYYKSYKIGYTNIEDVEKNNINGDLSQIDLPIYISSRFTNKKRVRIADIKNKNMRKFLYKLRIKKELHGIKINWALGMSLRFLENEV